MLVLDFDLMASRNVLRRMAHFRRSSGSVDQVQHQVVAGLKKRSSVAASTLFLCQTYQNLVYVDEQVGMQASPYLQSHPQPGVRCPFVEQGRLSLDFQRPAEV